MILSDIKRYLAQRGTASLSELSFHFDANPSAISGMLEQWIRKGRVIKQVTNQDCPGKCGGCDSENSVMYQWIAATGSSFKGIDITQS
jgi:hypothetical protein